MKKALKELINDLDGIMEEYEEVGDTDVKQKMYDAIHAGFIVPKHGYTLPDEFHMFSDEGNMKVRTVLQKFLAHPEVVAASKSIKTAEARLASFQDLSVKSGIGSTYDEYFGYAAKP